MKKRIVVACGGTGGHFYPGYALARALRGRGWETLFLLRTEDPAVNILAAEELPFVEADLRGFPRRSPLQWPHFLRRVGASLLLTRNALRAWHPACVAGMGGYLTFPAVAAARWLGIPSLLHESNAVLGLANRACLPFASRLALGMPLADPLRARVPSELTGTPVRPDLLELPSREEARGRLGLAPDRPTLLAFGGSQGARGINGLLPPALRLLSGTSPQVLHLAGVKEEATVRAAYTGADFPAQVLGYLQEMHLAYAAADLVVCRAGASTLAELAAARRPAVLIPYPFAAAGHQDANARVLERSGTAVRLPEPGLTPERLAATLRDLTAEPGPLAAMAQAYGRLGLPAPAETVARLVRAVEETADAR